MNSELQKKYGLPTATACCVFFCAAAVVSYGKDVLSYLIVFAAVMALAIPFYRPKAKAQ